MKNYCYQKKISIIEELSTKKYTKFKKLFIIKKKISKIS